MWATGRCPSVALHERERVAAREAVAVLGERMAAQAQLSSAPRNWSRCMKRPTSGLKRRAPMSRLSEPVSKRFPV